MGKVRYIAGSVVSVVVFPVVRGVRRGVRVRFTAATGGGSVYYTDDAAMQAALEAHPRYGVTFRRDALWLREQARAAAKGAAAKGGAAKGGAVKGAAVKGGAVALREVSVSDQGTAKNYIAEHFGVPRSNLKTKAAILSAASAHGVLFTGDWVQ